MILFSSSHQSGATVSIDELVVFTCRVSSQKLQWIYDRSDIKSEIIATHDSTAPLFCTQRNQSDFDNGVVIHSLLAAKNETDITSVLEVQHKMGFTDVTIHCRAIAGQEIVDRTFIFNITGKP